MSNYRIRRVWILPFVVEVWKEMPAYDDWKRGRVTWWLRVGQFWRRKTAEEYVAWLVAHDKDHPSGAHGGAT